MEGLVLKQWIVGKKLGSGACSDVYEAKPIQPLNGQNDMRFVIKLSPLVVMDAAKRNNKKRKKTPEERNADALYAEHLMYQSHLRDFPGLPHIPMGAYGEDKGYRFLVMQRLGRTLEQVLRAHGPIPPPSAARLGYDLLEILQHIHSKNIVYVDVKPENFMLNDEETRIYCVDFGIADRYISARGSHKECVLGGVVGTPTFLSLSCHQGTTASRRDDVEALLYVLMYLMRGDLPWQHAKTDMEGATLKKETVLTELCHDLPKEWITLLKKARACAFEAKPEYDFYLKTFVELGAKPGSQEPFQWQATTPKMAKMAIVDVPVSTSARKKSRNTPVLQEDGEPKSLEENASIDTPTTTKVLEENNRRKTRSSPKSTIEELPPPSEPTASDTDVQFVKAIGGKDPHRRRKAAAKAVVAAAAASAAAKQAASTKVTRYNLRGSK